MTSPSTSDEEREETSWETYNTHDQHFFENVLGTRPKTTRRVKSRKPRANREVHPRQSTPIPERDESEEELDDTWVFPEMYSVNKQSPIPCIGIIGPGSEIDLPYEDEPLLFNQNTFPGKIILPESKGGNVNR